jgi:hypothetical protein
MKSHKKSPRFTGTAAMLPMLPSFAADAGTNEPAGAPPRALPPAGGCSEDLSQTPPEK